MARICWFLLAALPLGCGSDQDAPAGASQLSDDAVEGVQAVFNPAFDQSDPDQFYDYPYPSDLRLTKDGTPNLSAFPNPANIDNVSGLAAAAGERKGFPAIPVGYFKFDAPVAEQDIEVAIEPKASSPVLLVDIDADSADRGKLYPAIAQTLAEDIYTPKNTLAVASWPGVVLPAGRKYAFVVQRSLKDAEGELLGVPKAFAEARVGKGANPELYSDLWDTLKSIDVAIADVAAATVFTTGDVVKDTFELTERMREKYTITIDDLALDPDDGASHDRFCELHGTMTLPQFQEGDPPFATGGRFAFGADGLPKEQREETAKVVITIPKSKMPSEGYPLTMYYHGSGGVAEQVVDRGRVSVAGGQPAKGEGPSHVLALHGFATVGSSHPVNPERLQGAGDTAYLNIGNFAALRDVFRQGVIEQRWLLDALLDIEISEAAVAGCAGPELPAGATGFKFDGSTVTAMGQSMGGMYTNLIAAVDPRIKAVVPTGAGGFWSYFVRNTDLLNLEVVAQNILMTKVPMYHVHPTIHLLQAAWEPSEPMVSMPRLATRPLEGHPARPIYEPVGKGDTYFPIRLYDAVVVAYGNQQAGDEVWPGMQTSLSQVGLDGLLKYPITDNLTSSNGDGYTGVVVQYEGDGIYDPHSIYGQLDEVKHQYGCFFETFVKTGKATVVAPADLGSPCQ